MKVSLEKKILGTFTVFAVLVIVLFIVLLTITALIEMTVPTMIFLGMVFVSYILYMWIQTATVFGKPVLQKLWKRL